MENKASTNIVSNFIRCLITSPFFRSLNNLFNLQLFGTKLEQEQKERIARELASMVSELIEKNELSFDEAEPVIKKILHPYSIKNPELADLILGKLEERYSENHEPIEV